MHLLVEILESPTTVLAVKSLRNDDRNMHM